MKKNKGLVEAVRKYLGEEVVFYKEGLYYFKSSPPGIYCQTAESFEKYWTYTERDLWKMVSRVKNDTTNGARDSSKKKRNRKIRYTEIDEAPNTRINTWEWD